MMFMSPFIKINAVISLKTIYVVISGKEISPNFGYIGLVINANYIYLSSASSQSATIRPLSHGEPYHLQVGKRLMHLKPRLLV